MTIATGHGKKAARHIDAWLRGDTYRKRTSNAMVGHEALHLWFQTRSPASGQRVVEPSSRADFREIVCGIDAIQAGYEASRCSSCGNCFECDGCYGSCPELAIEKLGVGRGYRVDPARCTGCNACQDQCPSSTHRAARVRPGLQLR